MKHPVSANRRTCIGLTYYGNPVCWNEALKFLSPVDEPCFIFFRCYSFFAPEAEERMGKRKTEWLRIQTVGRKFKWLVETLFRKFSSRCSLSFCFPNESERHSGEYREEERGKISSHGFSKAVFFIHFLRAARQCISQHKVTPVSRFVYELKLSHITRAVNTAQIDIALTNENATSNKFSYYASIILKIIFISSLQNF